jgi:orotate phosphoribosyltransferase
MATQLSDRSTPAGGNGVKRRALTSEALELRDLLVARTLKRGEFTLASGKRSRVYFNMKATMMHPLGAALCARLLLEKIAPLRPDYIGGLEMGAVPLLGTVAAYSQDAGTPIPAIFVRKAAKAHGTALMIEGLDDDGGETLAGKTIVLIDDVATSGGSIVQAIKQIETAGGRVSDSVVIVDRQEGADELLRSKGVTLHSLLTATDLGITEKDRAPLD